MDLFQKKNIYDHINGWDVMNSGQYADITFRKVEVEEVKQNQFAFW